ncbi:glutamate ABC transporter substrate-binding protein [Cellulomonas dongxiuzhuiae]|uniref:Glutamate ABC transporter substrate-binding protein n=1 Tax=Cellulomonas dongxiuzhuiae TaxID=2819979 RepID=A0ABX8GIH0_9CELL|nr:glutamate ABC transporter substrate-binding protein [Cellulomonas dongxiuzhuiae]MBO3094632.1 glutamate ABC transporter substrate-binding protein [Cellulomonas dongxiuzhuiae]QWC15643.1 glutamate ABC transporter substrate-binding protein [Cellulomonas dongxiuzhuiae]
MSTRRTHPVRAVLAATALVAVVLGGCATQAPDAGARVAPAPAAVGAAAPAAVECTDATTSYAPTTGTEVTAGSTMAAIRDRGHLLVGVSADTLRMGARNPFTGQIEGFDIDVARQVAQAILGNPDAIRFRVITAGDRLPVLQEHEVDLVVRAFTINCERWQDIAFSAEYFTAGQKVLVSTESDAQGIDDLSGQRVCAPDGTTTLERLEQYDVEAVGALTHSACLALFQQGRVDAITGDDTVLAGFVAQDPYARVVGEAFSAEPYGVGVAADQVDLVRFVNAVLDGMKADGTWTQVYDRWLGEALGPAPAPPTSVYGRS